MSTELAAFLASLSSRAHHPHSTAHGGGHRVQHAQTLKDFVLSAACVTECGAVEERESPRSSIIVVIPSSSRYAIISVRTVFQT